MIHRSACAHCDARHSAAAGKLKGSRTGKGGGAYSTPRGTRTGVRAHTWGRKGGGRRCCRDRTGGGCHFQ
eukprot:317167-Pyramimonas_sp.AAC.1